MECISVGQKLGVELPRGLSIRCDEYGFQLFINLGNLDKDEIKSFSDEKIDLGLFYDEETTVMDFLIRIEGLISESDICFNINLTPNKMDSLTKITDKSLGYSMTFILVEDNDNIVKRMRLFALPNDFSNVLYSCCKKQASRDFDNNKYMRQVLDLMDTNSVADLWAKSTIECSIGAGKVKYITNQNGEC